MSVPANKLGSPLAAMKNHKNIEFVHTIMAIFTGAIAGILGFTGLRGFLLFVLSHVVVAGACRRVVRVACVGGPMPPS